MRYEHQGLWESARQNVEAELFYRDLMAGGSARLGAPRQRRRRLVAEVEDVAVGQALISGRQLLVGSTGPAIAHGPALDDVLLAALGRRGTQWIVLGDGLGGTDFDAQAWGPFVAAPTERTIEFDTTAATAMVLGRGSRFFLRARATASSAADRLQWAHVPSVEEFLRLPLGQRVAQRNDWVRFIQRARVIHPVTRTDLTVAQLRTLASPVLRLLLAEHSRATLPVQPVTRDGADRGGVVNGVTQPMLRQPLTEPQVYLRVISSVEGKMESINAWDAGAGISLGPIQINVQHEALHHFLWDVWQVDRPLFEQALGNDWAMRESRGHPELRVRVAGSDVWLRASNAAEERRCIAFFQSGDPARAAVSDNDPAHRRRLSANFASLVAWPHVQELLEDTSATWLKPGLAQIHASGIPVLDPTRPDRDLFVLKALLLSTYVRFSGCLAPLLTALQAWPSVREKLSNWNAALAAMQGPCAANGTPAQRARNAELLARLERQARDALGTFTALEGILAARGATTRATAAPAEQHDVLASRCGFSGPSILRTLQEVRDAVRDAAIDEWQRWHTPAGLPRRENELATFGHLVRYALAAMGSLTPDALSAIQVATVGSIAYGPIPAPGASDADVRTWAIRIALQLLAGASGVVATAALKMLVARAAARARQSHLDHGNFSAWSAAWVTSCVRGAGIRLSLETMDAGHHVGGGVLLLPSTRHAEYTLEAHRRRLGPNRTDGTWQAFPPADRAPERGDIIVQDRQAQAPAVPLTYAQIGTLSAGRALHGDIVVERGADHLVTVGGNLSGGCRKRRYPLVDGRLVVQREQLYAHEDDSGFLAALPATSTIRLHTRSTLRILALLCPIEECAAVPGQPYGSGLIT